METFISLGNGFVTQEQLDAFRIALENAVEVTPPEQEEGEQ